MDKDELATFLKPLKFGEWKEEELEELFEFLDVRKSGSISIQDFSVGTRVHDGRDPNPELPNMGLWMGYYLVYYYYLPLGGI